MLGWILMGAGVTGAALAACSPQGHDKAYYAGDPGERTATLLACRNDPGRLGATPDCGAARSADPHAHPPHFSNLPTPASRVGKPGKL